MSKKMPLIFGLVWLLAATALYAYKVSDSQPDGVYSYDNDGCTIDQKVYVADNINNDKEGLIYEMDLYGKVTDFFSTKEIQERAAVRKVDVYDSQLYAVMEVPRSESDAGGNYEIIQFEDGLHVAALTPMIALYETDQLTDFVVDENGMYLVTVTANGGAASVYNVSPQQLVDVQTAQQSSRLTLESFLRQEAENGRFFVDASYEMGSISTRSDADLVSGPFELDDSIRYIYSLCHMSFGQLASLHSMYRIYWLLAVAGGWLLIFLGSLLFHNRNRVVYVAAVLELVLLLAVVGGTGALILKQVQTENTAKTKWFDAILNNVLYDTQELADQALADDDLYTSDEYTQLLERLNMAYGQMEGDGCVDLFFADTADLKIYASVSGRNQETVEERYFKAGSHEAQELIVPGGIASKKFVKNGKQYQILAATLGDFTDSGYALMCVSYDDAFSLSGWQNELVFALVIFALASLVCILVLAVQSSDLARLARSMQQVAGGKTDVERPQVYGGDMRALWNALGEIQKRIRHVNYSKFLAFEAYYRFAPKNIEQLLNKESITEVASGDVTKLNGTMAMISTVGPRSGSEEEIGRLNRLLALIGRYQEEKDGVFVSNDGALSILRFLFMEKNTDTLNSAVNFLKELDEQEHSALEKIPRTGILLHYSSFVYGVAGTKQQSSTFLVSQDTDEIEHFAAWFREHGLKLVISETVRERENYDGSLRCIGYIQMDSSRKMKMYEVLDAYNVRERDRKLAVCERFDQALELFYQHDFYLARSMFSDILKELPTDEIAKWYLFTCENYLNMEHAEDVPCCLCYEE